MMSICCWVSRLELLVIVRIDSALLNFNLRLKIIYLDCLKLMIGAFIFSSFFLIHGASTVKARMTTAAHTSRELSNAETSLAAFLVIIAAAHLRALILGLLLPRKRWRWENSIKPAWELSSINSLIGNDSGISRLKLFIFENHLLLLWLIVIKTFWKRRAFIPSINLFCTKLQSLEILRINNYSTGIRRDSTDRVYVRPKLLRLSWVTSSFSRKHMRFRRWLRWLATFALNSTKIGANTIFDAEASIKLSLMNIFLFQRYFRDDYTIARSDRIWTVFMLESSYCSRISSSWYRILCTRNRFNFRAWYSSPISWVTWAHYCMLNIIALS